MKILEHGNAAKRIVVEVETSDDEDIALTCSTSGASAMGISGGPLARVLALSWICFTLAFRWVVVL